jgi:hypothetical protein
MMLVVGADLFEWLPDTSLSQFPFSLKSGSNVPAGLSEDK